MAGGIRHWCPQLKRGQHGALGVDGGSATRGVLGAIHALAASLPALVNAASQDQEEAVRAVALRNFRNIAVSNEGRELLSSLGWTAVSAALCGGLQGVEDELRSLQGCPAVFEPRRHLARMIPCPPVQIHWGPCQPHPTL